MGPSFPYRAGPEPIPGASLGVEMMGSQKAGPWPFPATRPGVGRYLNLGQLAWARAPPQSLRVPCTGGFAPSPRPPQETCWPWRVQDPRLGPSRATWGWPRVLLAPSSAASSFPPGLPRPSKPTLIPAAPVKGPEKSLLK